VELVLLLIMISKISAVLRNNYEGSVGVNRLVCEYNCSTGHDDVRRDMLHCLEEEYLSMGFNGDYSFTDKGLNVAYKHTFCSNDTSLKGLKKRRDRLSKVDSLTRVACVTRNSRD